MLSKFKIECWFRYKDALDYEVVIIESTDKDAALSKVKKQYPTAMRYAITELISKKLIFNLTSPQ